MLSKKADLLASLKKRLSEEIAIGVQPALCLLGTHNQNVGGLLSTPGIRPARKLPSTWVNRPGF